MSYFMSCFCLKKWKSQSLYDHEESCTLTDVSNFSAQTTMALYYSLASTKFSLADITYSEWLCSSQLPHWPDRSSQQLMSVSNIVMAVQNEGGVHWYETLDSSNPSSLWLIPSAPVFKKWFITGEPASLSPAPALLRGAITARSAELGLPASDQTPVCFYRCSTAWWARPPARERKSELGGLAGWKAGLLLNTVRCSPPDNSDPVHPTIPP